MDLLLKYVGKTLKIPGDHSGVNFNNTENWLLICFLFKGKAGKIPFALYDVLGYIMLYICCFHIHQK